MGVTLPTIFEKMGVIGCFGAHFRGFSNNGFYKRSLALPNKGAIAAIG